MMRSFVLLVCAVVLLSGSCSTRVAYENHPSNVSRPDAIDINTASAEELEKLPHIGPKTAEAIVRFREDHGPFERVEEIMQVPKISEKLFLEIRAQIRATPQ